jgi:Kef-type K+ transport system membrane component KefB
MDESLVFLLVGGVLAISTIAAYVAIKFNVPTLVAFLAFGIVLARSSLCGF